MTIGIHRPRNPRPDPGPKWLVRRTEGDFLKDMRRKGRHTSVDSPLSYPIRPSLISSSEGRIDRLLMTIPSSAVSDSDSEGILRALCRSLPKDTGLVILTHQSSAPFVRQWPELKNRNGHIQIIEAKDHVAFTVWAEDPYVVVRDERTGAGLFVEPLEFPRGADALIADYVASRTDLLVNPSVLYFQGGNFLIGDDFILLGEDSINRTIGYIPKVISAPVNTDAREFIMDLFLGRLDNGRTIHLVGSNVAIPAATYGVFQDDEGFWVEERHIGNESGTVQPIFHIDMFITLAGRGNSGKYRLLVGDPRFAAELLGEPVHVACLADAFDSVSKNLCDLGFEVIRNPLPLRWTKERVDVSTFETIDSGVFNRLTEAGLTSVDVYRSFFASSNSALVQISQTAGNIVWLPTYGPDLGPTDAENERIWKEDLGFEVRLLPDFSSFAARLGAVHCLTKYLERES